MWSESFNPLQSRLANGMRTQMQGCTHSRWMTRKHNACVSMHVHQWMYWRRHKECEKKAF